MEVLQLVQDLTNPNKVRICDQVAQRNCILCDDQAYRLSDLESYFVIYSENRHYESWAKTEKQFVIWHQ